MLQIKSFLAKRNSHNIVLFNAILWSISYGILLVLFSENSSPSKIDYIYTSCFVITLIIPVLLNLYWLIPVYLKKEKYLKFGLFFTLNLIVFAELNSSFFNLINTLFFKDYYFISYHSKTVIYFILFIFFTLCVLIKLTENWVYLNQIENKALKLQKKQVERELYYLKGQINPHFLFNSLNVIYSLALDNNDNTTKAILQLSDILRYIIYDVENGEISIQKEIELIKNYIDFEKNRHLNDTRITLDIKVIEKVNIYPMLLIPIVENAFKHGVKSGIKNPFIEIKLHIINNILTFLVKNNFMHANHMSSEKNKGIGLVNVKENLTLVYKDKHSFFAEEVEGIFIVKLEIEL